MSERLPTCLFGCLGVCICMCLQICTLYCLKVCFLYNDDLHHLKDLCF